MLKKLPRSEIFVSISALVVSVCALIVTIRQTIIAQTQLNGSVWPNVLIGSSRPNRETYYLITVNQGIGPAIIRNINIVNQGVSYSDPVSLANKKLLPVAYTSIFSGRVVKPGEEIKLLVCERDSVLAQKLQNLFDRSQTVIEITYSDVYGNCWQSDGLRYKSIDDCPPIEEMKIE